MDDTIIRASPARLWAMSRLLERASNEDAIWYGDLSRSLYHGTTKAERDEIRRIYLENE